MERDPRGEPQQRVGRIAFNRRKPPNLERELGRSLTADPNARLGVSAAGVPANSTRQVGRGVTVAATGPSWGRPGWAVGEGKWVMRSR